VSRTSASRPADKPGPGASTAVIYVRVSTKEQAERDGDAEGYSIPAQREACKRKAASLDAAVIEEFADRGESARTADRPELQRLLDFVIDNDVTYVIVHKIDRLAATEPTTSPSTSPSSRPGSSWCRSRRTSTRPPRGSCSTAS
jgi:site-specific DNA recombinase